jgi:hypothetical protein
LLPKSSTFNIPLKLDGLVLNHKIGSGMLQ